MDKIGVLIVDDHPVVRQGLKNFFEAEGELEVRGVAASGEEAIDAVERLHPEVVMMDLVMPGMSGVEAIRHIKESWPEVRVIVVTTYAQDDKLFPAIKAGADGYLLKDTLPVDIIDAVKSVRVGRSVLHPDVAQKLMHSFSNRNKSSMEEKLTPRETEVIELIAMGIMPGALIRLIQKFPSYVFEAGNTQFAVDEQIADSVYVRLVEEEAPIMAEGFARPRRRWRRRGWFSRRR